MKAVFTFLQTAPQDNKTEKEHKLNTLQTLFFTLDFTITESMYALNACLDKLLVNCLIHICTVYLDEDGWITPLCKLFSVYEENFEKKKEDSLNSGIR